MSKPEPDPATDAVDPKEQMRAALEAKKNASHHHADGTTTVGKAGGEQGKHGGKRQFRRKAGG